MSKIRIELKSDTCFSSGDVYNSSIDTDVCYDQYGFPYIPAKRLKGCIRESALELSDFGVEINVNEIFGSEGNAKSKVIISNAKLADYNEYLNDILSCDKSEYTHSQMVLKQFTYIRNQTKIDKATGTAEETSLRSTRVLRKGLVFEAKIEFDDKYFNQLNQCCQNLRFMGLNRTRGMGEVEINLINDSVDNMESDSNVKWIEGKNYTRLDYSIKLLSPLLLKSVAGDQTKTVKYIEGSKILGMIAQNLDEEFIDFMSMGELICSNAYIYSSGKRNVPISSSIYYVKNQKNNLRDKTYKDYIKEDNKERIQLCRTGEWYVSSDTESDITKQLVDTEFHYHHARPADKSIGKVISGDGKSDKDNGKFYQLESICSGQIFSGYIIGTVEQIKKIYNIILKKRFQRIGYARTSEYGEIDINVIGLKETNINSPLMKNEFVIKFNSPVIVYNEEGMYSTDENVLLRYIEYTIGINGKLSIIDRFIDYEILGGYNTTWEFHKPIINAFASGTTLVLKMENDLQIDMSQLVNKFIGERVNEGYGEISIYSRPEKYTKKIIKNEVSKVQANNRCSGKLKKSIATMCAVNYIKMQGRKSIPEKDKRSNMDAVNSNIILMFKDAENYSQLCEFVRTRFVKSTELKNIKLEKAREIIQNKETLERILCDVLDRYPEADIDEDKLYRIYFKSRLLAFKYALKEDKSNEK